MTNKIKSTEICVVNLWYFHLEQMSDSYWWMTYDGPIRTTSINVGAHRALCPGVARVINNGKKVLKPSYEVRLNDDGSLDEVVACYPKSIQFFPTDRRSWQVTLVSKENHTIIITFGTKNIVKTFTNIEHSPPSEESDHWCVMCNEPEFTSGIM